MRLVSVSANIFVNPEYVTCVEQRNYEGQALTYIWVGDKSYVLTVPFEEFYMNLIAATEKEEPTETKQFFAG